LKLRDRKSRKRSFPRLRQKKQHYQKLKKGSKRLGELGESVLRARMNFRYFRKWISQNPFRLRK
jgi:hypothetical protein